MPGTSTAAILMVMGGAVTYFPPVAQQAPARCPGRGISSELCSYAAGDRACRPAFGRDEVAVNEFANKWFSKHLAAAGEPALFSQRAKLIAQGRSVLRFTWLRSFHPPVMVRVEWSARTRPHIISTELSGKGGYEPGGVRRRSVRPLIDHEIILLRDAIKAAQLERVPSAECRLGTDGAEWIYESISRGGYRVIVRWSPEAGPLRTLGLHLLRLTSLRVGEVY